MSHPKSLFSIQHDSFNGRGDYFVTDFAHEKNLERPFHTHDQCELAYIYHGSGTYHYLYEGREIGVPIKAGSIAIFSGKIPHRNRDPEDPLSQILIVFDKSYFYCGANRELFERYFNDEVNRPYIRDLPVFFSKPIETQLRNLLLYSKKGSRENALAVISSFNAILSILAQEESSPTRASIKNKKDQSLQPISQILELLENNPVEHLALSEAAAKTGLSEKHFLTQFKARTGKTFYAFQLQKRVEYARSLLTETDLPIIRIAFEVGFDSLSSFNRQFQKQFQKPPSDFRKK